MIRVHIICEGPTEQAFVSSILQPRFQNLHMQPELPQASSHGSKKRPSGHSVIPHAVRLLKQDRSCVCTTFIDYYARVDFIEDSEPQGSDPSSKALRVETPLVRQVSDAMGPSFNAARWRPYFSMHEFEALLFSDVSRLATGLSDLDLSPISEALLAEQLVAMSRSLFGGDATANPELINDGLETAPSKRLVSVCPRYDKVLCGSLIAQALGLETIRARCPHFAQWLDWLERLNEGRIQ